MARGSGRGPRRHGSPNEHKLDNAGLRAAWKLKIIQSQGSLAVRENLVSQRSPAEVLGNAGVPAEHRFTTTGLIGCEGAHLYNTGLISCEGAHLYNTGLIGCEGAHLYNTGLISCEGAHLYNTGLISCEGAHLYNTGLIGCEGAHLYNTGLIGCEGAHLYNTGLIGCEGAHSYNRRAHHCEGELVDAALSCGELGIAAVSCEANLMTRSPSREAHLITQSPSCEEYLVTQILPAKDTQGCEARSVRRKVLLFFSTGKERLLCCSE